MPSSFRSSLNDLASSFADSVFAAIRGASLDELLPESRERPNRLPAHPKGTTTRSPKTTSAPGVGAKSSRLPRRSADDIAAALKQVVAVVKKNKEGLRAEQIREELNIQAKELPRVLKEGLSTKTLKSKGQKRATTYFAP